MPTLSRRFARTAVCLAAVALGAGCSRKKAPAPSSNPLVYVSDEEGGLVVVVDPARAEVVARIPVGKRPRGLKVARDGTQLFVALSGSPRAGPGVDESKLPPGDRTADGIGVVDLATRKLVRTLPSGQDPETFDLSPDGKTLYVSNEETAEMSALDLASGVLRGKAKVGREPEGVTVRPDGKVVFVTSEVEGKVTAVDATTLAAIADMPTAPRPRAVVFTQDGRTAFVTDEAGGRVTILDATAFRPEGDIEIHANPAKPGPARPMGAALSPDGKQVFVTTGRAGSVAVIDVATRKQVRSIDGVGDRPWGLASSADGARLYTANGTSHDLSIVDVATGTVERRVDVGGLPWGAVVGP